VLDKIWNNFICCVWRIAPFEAKLRAFWAARIAGG
jgi:hypothetical protein